jgi:hypothetical protein
MSQTGVSRDDVACFVIDVNATKTEESRYRFEIHCADKIIDAKNSRNT